MQPHTRAIVAASTFAILTGHKVAGVYDHSASRRLKIAAECRGNKLRGLDGERGVKFGGDLPELYDAGDMTYVSLKVDCETIRGHDRRSACDFSAHVNGALVQLYDYAASTWFTYDIQGPESGKSYYR